MLLGFTWWEVWGSRRGGEHSRIATGVFVFVDCVHLVLYTDRHTSAGERSFSLASLPTANNRVPTDPAGVPQCPISGWKSHKNPKPRLLRPFQKVLEQSQNLKPSLLPATNLVLRRSVLAQCRLMRDEEEEREEGRRVRRLVIVVSWYLGWVCVLSSKLSLRQTSDTR